MKPPGFSKTCLVRTSFELGIRGLSSIVNPTALGAFFV